MASISIDRAKYRANKSNASWLDNWLEAQVKSETEVKKTIGEKEITSKTHRIDPVKLFALIKANGLDFPKAQAQVEADQQGAIGRARMIFSGVIQRKIHEGHVLKDVDGNDVAQDEAFNAFKASLSQKYTKAAKPAVEAPAAPVEGTEAFEGSAG